MLLLFAFQKCFVPNESEVPMTNNVYAFGRDKYHQIRGTALRTSLYGEDLTSSRYVGLF